MLLFVAGAVSAVQQAANGQLRVVADDVVGRVVRLVPRSARWPWSSRCSSPASSRQSSFPSAAWLYLGGPLGLIYILVGAATVRALGVLRFVLGVVSGQLLAAVVIDAAWPAPNTTLRATTVIGAVVTLVGVWLSGRDGVGASTATLRTDQLGRTTTSATPTRRWSPRSSRAMSARSGSGCCWPGCWCRRRHRR